MACETLKFQKFQKLIKIMTRKIKLAENEPHTD